MENIDTYISKIWNENNKYECIVEENTWDICRTLEQKGYLVGDNAAISAISIGPFKFASTMDINRKDMMIYFFSTIVPIMVSKASGKTFEQFCSLYLTPAIIILINLFDKNYWIKDSLQWQVLIFIKDRNRNGIYPTGDEIKESTNFSGLESWQIDMAIEGLKEVKTVWGDKHSLIQLDFDNRIKCLV